MTNTYLSSAYDVSIVICSVITNLYRSSEFANLEKYIGRHVFLATWLGLMFDGLDATICVLALYPALSDLLGSTSHASVGLYGGIVLSTFMAGWGIGAILFGFLSDRIGRVRSMLLTILVYAVFTGLCATSHSWLELAVYRFLVGCGIGGEQMAGVVLLAETFRGRARIIATGYLVTAFGTGYIIAGLLNLVLGPLGWRWLFLAGMVPALMTLYVRVSVKESAEFLIHSATQKKDDAKSPYWEILSPEYIGKTINVSTLASTAIVGYWAVMSWLPPWINELAGTLAVKERSIFASPLLVR